MTELSVQGNSDPSPSCEQHHKQKFNYGRRKAIKEDSIFLAFINQVQIYELYFAVPTGENKNNEHKNQGQNLMVLLYYHACKRSLGTLRLAFTIWGS